MPTGWSALACPPVLPRDRLYGEILKKKKEMLRLMKEKEAQWAARHAPAPAASNGRSAPHAEHHASNAKELSGRQSAQAQGGLAGRKSGSGHHH